MSDSNRQGLGDKITSSLKACLSQAWCLFTRLTPRLSRCQPDEQKSMTERIGDKAKGIYDDAASTLQPQVRRCIL